MRPVAFLSSFPLLPASSAPAWVLPADAEQAAPASPVQAEACAPVGARPPEALVASAPADSVSAPDDSAPDDYSAAPQEDGCSAVAPPSDDHSSPVAELDDLSALPVDDSIPPEQLDVDLERLDLELADSEPADCPGGSRADCPGGSPIDWQATDLQTTAPVVLDAPRSAEPPDGQWWPSPVCPGAPA